MEDWKLVTATVVLEPACAGFFVSRPIHWAAHLGPGKRLENKFSGMGAIFF